MKTTGLRPTLSLVVGLNLGMFAAEILVALASGSVSLFADSVDFLEDASITLLVLVGIGWSARAKAHLGLGLAAIILVPSLATLAMAWHRFAVGTPPEAVAVGATGLVALGVNTACAVLLARHRASGGSLTRAAFLSARNDTIANVAIVAVGIVTLWWRSPWPDLGVGLAIGLLNGGAAWEVWEAACDEHRSAGCSVSDDGPASR